MRIMDHKVLRKERSILVIMVEQLRLQILMLTMIWISHLLLIHRQLFHGMKTMDHRILQKIVLIVIMFEILL